MTKLHIFTIPCLLLLLSCGQRKNTMSTTHVDSLYVFDFEKALTEKFNDTLTLNDLSNNITSLHLDPHITLSMSNLLLAEWKDGYVVSSGIANTAGPIMLFDHEGKFKKYLVRLGRGPGEVLRYLTWYINPKKGVFTIFGNGNLLSYSLSEMAAKNIPLDRRVNHVMYLNDGNYVDIGSAYGDPEPSAPYLSFFNETGVLINTLRGHDNYIDFSDPSVWPLESRGLYQSHTGDALFREMFNDTIFRVSAADDIRPYMCMHRGKFAPKKEDSFNAEKKHKQIFIRNITESDKYVSIDFIYKNTPHSSLWDKTNCRMLTAFARDSGPTMRRPGFIKYHTPADEIIIVEVLAITSERMYCALHPRDAQKFIPNISDNSNPVVLIAELK